MPDNFPGHKPRRRTRLAPAPDFKRDPAPLQPQARAPLRSLRPRLLRHRRITRSSPAWTAHDELDEASGAAMDSYGTRTLANFGNPVGTAAGKINTSRNFPGGNAYFCSLNTTDFSPGSNHFFFSLWAKAGNRTQGQRDTGFLSPRLALRTTSNGFYFTKTELGEPTLAVSLNDRVLA